MTITTTNAKERKWDFAYAANHVKVKKINGRLYWYGEISVDALFIRNRKSDGFGRISKNDAAEVLSRYNITLEQFAAYTFGELEIVEVKEANVEDYAVTNEAQDIAIDAEIELANTEQAPAVVETEKSAEIIFDASALGYTGNHIAKDFNNPISAYKWLRRLAKKSRNYHDGAMTITRWNPDGSRTIVYDSAGSRLVINDNALKDFIDAQNIKDHIEGQYCSLCTGAKFYQEHFALTQEQAEQILVAIHADKVSHEQINQMIEAFKANNEAPANVEVATDAEIELANSEHIPTITVSQNRFFGEKNLVVVKFDGKRVAMKDAVADIRHLFKNSPFQVVNQHGDSFTVTEHMSIQRLSQAYAVIEKALRDCADHSRPRAVEEAIAAHFNNLMTNNKSEQTPATVEVETENAISAILRITKGGNIIECPVGETGSRPSRLWYCDHEIACLKEQDVIELANKMYGSQYTTALCKFIANDTDGSEEDDEPNEVFNLLPDFDEEDDDDENNEPEILNADIFNNLYQSPHDERFSSRTIKLGTDALYFNKQRLTAIYGRNGLSLHFKNGKMRFRSNGRVIARDKVAEIYMNSQIAIEQGKTFTELLKASKAHNKGFFEAWIGVTFANKREHHVSRCFDKFNDAKDFVDNVRKIFADSPVWAFIQANKQCGQQYYLIRENGSEFYDLPNVEFFKDYTREEIQNRIAELNKAIEDTNHARYVDELEKEQGLIRRNLRITACDLEETRDFYEFVLREAELKTDERNEILSTPLVTVAAANQAYASEYFIANKNNYQIVKDAQSNLPKGYLEVTTGADAFKLVAPYFPKGLKFVATSKFFNGEDEFTFADDAERFYLVATCTKDNSRVYFMQVVDTDESGSKRKPLTVTINHATNDNTADLKPDREIKIGDDILTFINGTLDNVYSTKYGAMIQFLPDGGRKYFTRPLSLNGKTFDNDFDRWDIEDFFAILTERGAFTTDHKAKPLTREEIQGMLEKAQMTVSEKQDALEKAKPAERQKAQYELDRAFDALTGLERLLADSEDSEDIPAESPAIAADFTTKLAELEAAQDAAKAEYVTALNAANDKKTAYEQSQLAINEFLIDQATLLTEKIRAVSFKTPLDVVAQDGSDHDIFGSESLHVDAFNDSPKRFNICNHFCVSLAGYDTPAQVEEVIKQFAAAIERGDKEFKFPTVEELTRTATLADSLARGKEAA